MAQDSWRTARWRDKLRVWVARTGWRPADVAAQYPREKNDLSHFARYDPKVPTRVSVYGFFQLVSVVLLLNLMEGSELPYWQGFAGWAILLATTVTTALWLEGRSAPGLLRWELLRLGAIGLLLALAAPSGLSFSVLALASVYAALNLLFLLRLSRLPQARDTAPAT